MTVRILRGDCREVLRTLPDESVHTVVTSPPYWGLRDYGVSGQLGLEETPDEYIEKMVAVFGEVRRVLRADGTVWLNMGDSYAGSPPGNARPDHSGPNLLGSRGGQRSPGATLVRAARDFSPLKPKDLAGIPWMLAFALRADGWYLRQDIIWSKPNPMPESVRDRCTKAHEYIFLLSKGERYYYDAEAIKELASENTNPRRAGNGWKTPDGWDTTKGEGGHGSFHRKGREKGRVRKMASYRPSGWAERDNGAMVGRYPRPKNNESFDAAMAIMPEFRNKRSVWTVTTQPFKEAHFATFPPALIEPCILAGAPRGGVVLDPFGGAGTTGLVADRHSRDAVLIELNPDYAAMAEKRIRGDAPLFAEVS